MKAVQVSVELTQRRLALQDIGTRLEHRRFRRFRAAGCGDIRRGIAAIAGRQESQYRSRRSVRAAMILTEAEWRGKVPLPGNPVGRV